MSLAIKLLTSIHGSRDYYGPEMHLSFQHKSRRISREPRVSLILAPGTDANCTVSQVFRALFHAYVILDM